jgi:hypothetical protein
MTTGEFRQMALSLPEAEERAHMGHPDFRAGGKIFATLFDPAKGIAMVKLTPEQQRIYIQADPKVFVPAQGAWGARGSTLVHLKHARAETVQEALREAWAGKSKS